MVLLMFDRGLANLHGFNHEEAISCFKKALEIENNCYMAAWGVAYANGVNYNSANTMINEKEAFDQAQFVYQHRNEVDDVEALLFEAIVTRYVYPMPEDSVQRNAKQNELNILYANAMEKVYKAYPDDVDIVALYIESLLDITPWRLWVKDANGNYPQSSYFVEKLLEDTIQKYPLHPGLLHLYIHCEELSPKPEKALDAANKLRTLVPDGGHLLHMASHIDVWVGDYESAIIANQKGVAADEKFVRLTGKKHNFYLGYRIHNYHFLSWACMIDGQYNVAKAAAEEIQRQLVMDAVKLFPDFFEAFTIALVHVYIRFGKWEEILQLRPPEDQDFWCSQAIMYYYARAIAYAALGQVDKALQEEQLFLAAKERPQLKTRRLHNNLMLGNDKQTGIVNVAEQMLRGEIEYRRGNYEASFNFLRRAVELDDSLIYDEPWGWMVPARQALGALLLEQNHVEEAVKVFQKDLQMYPNNMWTLHGLASCYKKLNKTEEFNEYRAKFETASKRSDVAVNAACFCANRPMQFQGTTMNRAK